MAKRIIQKNVVDRKPGKFYYIDGKGNLGEADMKTKGKKSASSKSMPKKSTAKKSSAKKKTGRTSSGQAVYYNGKPYPSNAAIARALRLDVGAQSAVVVLQRAGLTWSASKKEWTGSKSASRSTAKAKSSAKKKKSGVKMAGFSAAQLAQIKKIFGK